MSMFIRLPVTISDSTLPVIPPGDIRYLSNLEENAYEHWMFGGDAGSLVGRVNSIPLTPQGSDPAYQSGYLTLDSEAGQGLLSGITDAELMASGGGIMFAVVKHARYTSNPSFIFGCRDSSSGVGVAFSQATSPNHQISVFSASSIPITTATVAPDVWRFIALAFGPAWAMFSTLEVSDEIAGTYTPADREIALGNGYHASTPSGRPIHVAEFGITPGAYDLSMLQSIYHRSKARMAARGIGIA